MIRFDNVTKAYQRGHTPALEDLTIEFERGEFVFLVGASGSGKSTLMRLVLKETSPTRGNVYVAGKDLARIPSWRVPTLRRDIGMVFQDFRLLPSKTAYQNIEFALAVIGTPRKVVRRLVPEMLEMVGLEDKGRRLPHELSGGEQQRVAIARAYVNRPSILLADEPTGNLDPATAEGILDLLSQINERGTTVVMATHDRSAVDRMERRVVEMVGGHVVRDEEMGRYQSVVETSVISGNLPDGEDISDRAPEDEPGSSDSDTGSSAPSEVSGSSDVAPGVEEEPRARFGRGRRRAAASAALAASATSGEERPPGAASDSGTEDPAPAESDEQPLAEDSSHLAGEIPTDPSPTSDDSTVDSRTEDTGTGTDGELDASGHLEVDAAEDTSRDDGDSAGGPSAPGVDPSSPWIEDVVVDDVVDEDHYDPRDAREDEVDAAFREGDEDQEVIR